MRNLYTFHGGFHPAEHKLESSELPCAIAPLPQRLVLPLQQHIGTAAKAVLQAGDKVLKGQLIAHATGAVSAAVHAPSSGVVLATEPHSVPHPSGLKEQCITLATDGEERWIEHTPVNYRTVSKDDLVGRLRDGGIVGLGGATFPTHIKLIANKSIQTLILNGVECEPWITTDDSLMRERAAEIVQGIEILRHILDPAETLICIEDNKPQAIAAMQHACASTSFEVVIVPTLYPAGGEKQLIKVVTGKEVPSGGRPQDIGVVCSNVATAYSVHRLVNHGEPMLSRRVTVTGNVAVPQNFEVLLGTTLEELVNCAGGALPGSLGYILGGSMMGLHVTDGSLPVVKSTNCLIVKSATLFPSAPQAMPCIRCTRCAQVCPADLQPHELYWFASAKNFVKAEKYHIFDCIECAACDYVCPSHIPLVQYYRFAKSEIRAQQKERAAADKARTRYEFRLQRLALEKQEKVDKLAKRELSVLDPAKNLATKSNPAAQDNAQSLIQAALERARLQAAAAKPQNMEQLTPAQQAQIDAIEARRKL